MRRNTLLCLVPAVFSLFVLISSLFGTTRHTIIIDGVNDFAADEMLPTSTPGYTNWMTWDGASLFLGFYGADIAANDPGKLITVYIGPNAPASCDWAYGHPFNSQQTVLPFKADYIFSYNTTNGTGSASWTGTAWDWAVNPFSGGVAFNRSGNYLEVSIAKGKFGGPSKMSLYMQYLNTNNGSQTTYGAAPAGSLTDGFQANPSNFLYYTVNLWADGISPSSNIYKTNDIIKPSANALVFPTGNYTHYAGLPLTLTNSSADEIGIYKIDIYTNLNAFYATKYVTHASALQTYTINPGSLPHGTYQIYTIAYDTKNSCHSSTTNTLYYSTNHTKVHWIQNGADNLLSAENMPAGYCKATVYAADSELFRLYYDTNINAQSWSGGVEFTKTSYITNLPRNDQGIATDGTLRTEGNPAYATIISVTNPSGTAEMFGALYTVTPPASITTVSNNLPGTTAWNSSNTTVYVTLNQAKGTKENVFVRYTTNNWSSATEILATGADSNYSAVIPGMPANTTVRYYAMTTTVKATPTLTNGPDSYANFITLACNGDTVNSHSYYVHGTPHTIAIDGVNDFCTNSSEIFLTTTAGYTNWQTWDDLNYYFGWYGADMSADNPDKLLMVYFSTNTNGESATGSAYGVLNGSQMPVLPFKADFVLKYATDDKWDSAAWTGTEWDWSENPLNSHLSAERTGNYLEFSITKDSFASSPSLVCYAQMVNKTAGSETTYAAIPAGTLTDGYLANPSNTISHTNIMWNSRILPAQNYLKFYDSKVPYSNMIIFPIANTTNHSYNPITVTNYHSDNTGIWRIDFYTNTNALYATRLIQDSTLTQTFSIPTYTLPYGTYHFYTVAYDTRNSLSSATNTVVIITNWNTNVKWRYESNDYTLNGDRMPPGFCKYTATVDDAKNFYFYYNTLTPATTWSSGYDLYFSYGITNIPRNDFSGNNNNAKGYTDPSGTQTVTVITRTNISASSETFGLLTPGGTPTFIVSASNSLAGGSAWSLSNTTVLMTLNANKLANEAVMVRYTTNNWATAQEVPGTGSNSNYTAVIPGMPANTTVRYYVMTTTSKFTNKIMTGPDSNVDYLTLSCLGHTNNSSGYYVHGTPHTITIDGANDFCTNTSELFLTTTDGYSNWLTWDAAKFYLGYYGADISADDPEKMLIVYLSTNSTAAAGKSAYGDWFGSQFEVLPFKADYILSYNSANTVGSASWTGTNWDWSADPLSSGVAFSRGGNYMELSITKAKLGNSQNLNVFMQFVNTNEIAEWTYGAVPDDSLNDSYNPNPGGFIRFPAAVWKTNIIPSSNIYLTYDSVDPDSNAIIFPPAVFTNWAHESLDLTNYCNDDVGIYKYDIYINNNYFDTKYVQDSNAVQTYTFNPWDFSYGTYQVHTVAYDTLNASTVTPARTLFINTNCLRTDSEVFWIWNSKTYTLSTANMPTNFCKYTLLIGDGKSFRIYYQTNITTQSWSALATVKFADILTNIARNDQGSSANGIMKTIGKATLMSTLISSVNPAAASERFGLLTPGGTPTYITSISNSLTDYAWSLSNTRFFITLNTNKLANEAVLVRYSTNSWVTAGEVVMTGATNYYTGVIPGMPANTTVQYYALTTTILATNKLMTGPDSDVDYMTLSCLGDASNSFSYYVHGTPHTLAIDGVNDFCTNYSELFTTSTAGYTSWLTWDISNFYIGYQGADINAGTANKLLNIYFSTNTNTNTASVTGTAYGVWNNSQMPVLPFKANYIFQYDSAGAWDSAAWTGTQWDWAANPLNNGTTLNRTGNYLEIKISKTNFGSSKNLRLYTQFVNKTAGSERTYGAVPNTALTDGFLANPSNYISYTNMMWNSNIIPASNLYQVYDTIAPGSNYVVSPTNLQTNYATNTLTITNYCSDDIGIYRIWVYTNTNVILTNFMVSNTNSPYVITLPPYTLFHQGTYPLYTEARDTMNRLASRNTNIIINLTNGIEFDIQKVFDRAVIGSTNLILPGAIVYYKLTYGNSGNGAATNTLIFDRIATNAVYYTNYMGTASGWETQFAHIDQPDQTYGSADYDSGATNVTWVRFRKPNLAAYETNKTIYVGVIIK